MHLYTLIREYDSDFDEFSLAQLFLAWKEPNAASASIPKDISLQEERRKSSKSESDTEISQLIF